MPMTGQSFISGVLDMVPQTETLMITALLKLI